MFRGVFMVMAKFYKLQLDLQASQRHWAKNASPPDLTTRLKTVPLSRSSYMHEYVSHVWVLTRFLGCSKIKKINMTIWQHDIRVDSNTKSPSWRWHLRFEFRSLASHWRAGAFWTLSSLSWGSSARTSIRVDINTYHTTMASPRKPFLRDSALFVWVWES